MVGIDYDWVNLAGQLSFCEVLADSQVLLTLTPTQTTQKIKDQQEKFQKHSLLWCMRIVLDHLRQVDNDH